MDAETPVDEAKRDFLIKATCTVGGIGAVCALTPFVASWLPSEAAIAKGAPVTVDLSQLTPGQQMVVGWRGRPVWIIRRTKDMLAGLDNHNAALRDPNSEVPQQPSFAKNEYRSKNPEYLVLIGICTHLGCSPKYVPTVNELGPDWPGGFFCPCHGSKFDLSGRVFKGVPAPINLEVPPYRYINDTTIIVGENDA